jgi:hypothetical protein
MLPKAFLLVRGSGVWTKAEWYLFSTTVPMVRWKLTIHLEEQVTGHWDRACKLLPMYVCILHHPDPYTHTRMTCSLKTQNQNNFWQAPREKAFFMQMEDCEFPGWLWLPCSLKKKCMRYQKAQEKMDTQKFHV